MMPRARSLLRRMISSLSVKGQVVYYCTAFVLCASGPSINHTLAFYVLLSYQPKLLIPNSRLYCVCCSRKSIPEAVTYYRTRQAIDSVLKCRTRAENRTQEAYKTTN
jgi:hypothetical protein